MVGNIGELLLMKNFNTKVALVAGVAALALTGTAYAAWQFNTVVDTDKDASGLVTAAIEAKDVTVSGADTLYLVLDACDNASHNHGVGKGIYWASDAEGNTAVTELTLTGTVNYEANDIVDYSKYVGHFEVTSDLADTTYITFGESTDPADVTVNSVDGDCVATYTLPVPSYKTCPTSVEEVSEMRAELSSFTFTINFNVKEVIA